jgi:hypothetical protein
MEVLNPVCFNVSDFSVVLLACYYLGSPPRRGSDTQPDTKGVVGVVNGKEINR